MLLYYTYNCIIIDGLFLVITTIAIYLVQINLIFNCPAVEGIALYCSNIYIYGI